MRQRAFKRASCTRAKKGGAYCGRASCKRQLNRLRLAPRPGKGQLACFQRAAAGRALGPVPEAEAVYAPRQSEGACRESITTKSKLPFRPEREFLFAAGRRAAPTSERQHHAAIVGIHGGDAAGRHHNHVLQRRAAGQQVPLQLQRAGRAVGSSLAPAQGWRARRLLFFSSHMLYQLFSWRWPCRVSFPGARSRRGRCLPSGGAGSARCPTKPAIFEMRPFFTRWLKSSRTKRVRMGAIKARTRCSISSKERLASMYQVAQQHHNARFTRAGAFGIQHADFQRGGSLPPAPCRALHRQRYSCRKGVRKASQQMSWGPGPSWLRIPPAQDRPWRGRSHFVSWRPSGPGCPGFHRQ